MSTEAHHSERLAIRSSPRPVRRFSKKALAGVLGGASLLVLASVGVAMSPRDGGRDHAPRELYSTANKPKAEGLSALPAEYSEVEPERSVPELGPPLPGDLGAPILRAQREGRVAFDDLLPAKRAVTDDATLARLAEFEARAEAQNLEAQTSDVFFNIRKGASRRVADTAPSLSARSERFDPFAALASLSEASGGGGALADPNRQDRKEAFLDTPTDASIYNPHRVQTPVSPYQVMAGTMISASLLTGVNSDLPGQVIAQVTEPVYDTVTGEHLLIPQGSRVIGRYDSVIAYGQSRALIVWNRIIMPDGSSVQIENLPATDVKGYAGLSDRVDHHTLRLFSAAALSSLISVGAELSEDDDEQVARALRDAVQNGASRAGEKVVRRQLAVQPTIKIRPGWRLRILVQKDIVL
ncbi:MAG: TrbI/VirB10 family protein [Pseudomonadota bacterium]